MFHYDADEDILVLGFPTIALATEYARRRTRDSLEELRSAALDDEDLRRRWYAFGEDCIVIDGGYAGASEIDDFIAHPASAEARDWQAIERAVEGGRT